MLNDRGLQIKVAASLLAIAVLVSLGWLLLQAFSGLKELRSKMGEVQDGLDQLQTDVDHVQVDFSAITTDLEALQSQAAIVGSGGECLNTETMEVLEQVEDADGVLWPVKKLPGEYPMCAVPWEVSVDTNGHPVIVIYIDESGKEIQEPSRLAEWVYHPSTGKRIHTAPHTTRVVRQEGYEWSRKE